MKRTILVFPDASSLLDFVLIYKPKQVEVNSADLTINGPVNDNLLTAAVVEYGAEIRKNRKERNSPASGRVLHNTSK